MSNGDKKLLILAVSVLISILTFDIIAFGGIHAEKPDEQRTMEAAAEQEKESEEESTVVSDINMPAWATVAIETSSEELYQAADDQVLDAEFDSEIEKNAQNEAEIEFSQPEMDIWDMGYEWYGISYLDTTRSLKIITYEGYGYSDLSYYVACACWSRCMYPEDFGLWPDLYESFGGYDAVSYGGQYGAWMDNLDYECWAAEYLEMCYRDPMYIDQVNGMMVPSEYIYTEDGIYVWN